MTSVTFAAKRWKSTDKIKHKRNPKNSPYPADIAVICYTSSCAIMYVYRYQEACRRLIKGMCYPSGRFTPLEWSMTSDEVTFGQSGTATPNHTAGWILWIHFTFMMDVRQHRPAGSYLRSMILLSPPQLLEQCGGACIALATVTWCSMYSMNGKVAMEYQWSLSNTYVALYTEQNKEIFKTPSLGLHTIV